MLSSKYSPSENLSLPVAGIGAWIERFFPAEPVSRSFVGLFAIALTVRLVFLAIYMFIFSEQWKVQTFGHAEMGSIAVNLYKGRGFSSPFGPGSSPTAWFSPLVPALWATVMHLVGGATGRAEQVIILLQAVPSALSSAFYWLIAGHLAYRMRLVSTHVAAVVAGVSCLWPESLLRLTDTWYYFWQELGVAALVWCAIKWYDNPDLRRGLIMGVIAGYIGLVNPTPVPIFAVALIFPVLKRRGHRTIVARNAIASAIVSLMIVTPWLVRNILVFKHFIPMRSNLGIELLQGNNSLGHVRQGCTSPHPAIQKEELKRYIELGEIEYAREAFSKAMNYMYKHPGETLVRISQRVYVTWCTDVFDHWAWFPGNRWWYGGNREKLFMLVTIPSAILPLGIVLIGLLFGRLRRIPYKSLIISVFLFLPLLYYFTIADNDYSQGIRQWLAMLAIIVLFNNRRKWYMFDLQKHLNPLLSAKARLNIKLSYIIDHCLSARTISKESLVVSGFWRSGTSWIQQSLATLMNAKSVFEPLDPIALSQNAPHFNQSTNMSIITSSVYMPFAINNFDDCPALYSYLKKSFKADLKGEWIRKARKSIKESFRRKVVVKFVRGHLCLPAIQKTFSVPIIHLYRDPRAIIASVKRGNWWSGWLDSFSLSEQLIYLNDGRSEFFNYWVDDIIKYDKDGGILRVAAYWALTERFVRQCCIDHRPKIIFVSYENLQENLEDSLREILEQAGIKPIYQKKLDSEAPGPTTWGERRKMTGKSKINSWKKELMSNEIKAVESIALHFSLENCLTDYVG